MDRKPLHTMTRDLVEVASGRRSADLVIRNGHWVNVYTREIIPSTTIAIVGCRIAYCGRDRAELMGPNTQLFDAEDRYLVPGLLDAHVHIESSMLSVRGFAGAVLPHGTTGAFIDPHEIANVMGMDGVRLMVDEALATPLAIYVQIPSCVPAAPGMETSGATIGPAEVREALAWPEVIGLGEVMNYPGVVAGDQLLHDEMAETLKARKVIGGHYAGTDLGVAFHAYAAAGPSDCHEGTRPEDVLVRLQQGMYAILRQGSSEQNVAVQARAVAERAIDTRHVLLCTDDRHADTLKESGHMDDVLRRAMAEGIPPVEAIQMATLNTAEHFGVAQDVGSIGPGRYADLLIVSNLQALSIDTVFAAGRMVWEEGALRLDQRPFTYPPAATASIHLSERPKAEQFQILSDSMREEATCRVIEVVESQVLTRCAHEPIPVVEGVLEPIPATGISKLCVMERHKGTGRVGHGLVKGYGLVKPFGLASSVAHDCHNLMVMGSDNEHMAEAAGRVAELGGGICLVGQSGTLCEIALPIAGLMTTESLDTVSSRMDDLRGALSDLGCRMKDALMSFLFLALPVIPSLRLTDLGLVDVETFQIVPLIMSSDNASEEEERCL